MVNMKYFLAGISCVVLLALAPVSHAEASTLVDGETGIKDMSFVDADDQELIFNTGENSRLYVSFPTVKDGVIVKEGKWVSYAGGPVCIDLSGKKVTGDFYVAIKGNKDKDMFVFHFGATDSALKAVVTNTDKGANVELQYKKGENAGKPATGLEYTTSNGNWRPFIPEYDFSMYQENGATLRFRVAAKRGKTEPAKTNLKTNPKKGETAKEVPTYEVSDTFASNEVKVKLGKRPAGPKISVNYKTHTFTVSKGYYAMYQGAVQLFKSSNSSDSKFTVEGDQKITDIVKDQKELNVLKLLKADTDTTLIGKDGAIEAWLGADTQKNKPRSAFTEVAFNGVVTLAAVKSTDGTVKDAKIYKEADGAGKAVTATAQEITSGKNQGKYNVVVKNDAGCVYEIVAGDSASIPDTAIKTTAVKPGKTVTLKNLEGNKAIYVRLAADTKAKIWSSAFVKLGTVNGSDDMSENTEIKMEVDEANSNSKKLAFKVTPQNVTFTMDRAFVGEWEKAEGEMAFVACLESVRASFEFTVTANGKSQTFVASCPIRAEYPNGKWFILTKEEYDDKFQKGELPWDK